MIQSDLRSFKNRFVRWLAKQIVFQLDHGDLKLLAKRIVPDVSLEMGIPIPLASVLTTDVYNSSVGDFLNQHCKAQLGLPATRALDLGCGLNPANPFGGEILYGVDIRGETGSDIVPADLFNSPIPFADAFFDFVTAFDFIEHVPRTVCEQGVTRFPFVQLMDEISRVLRPGGLFLSSTPAFPSQQVFQDPTHVNPITENTFPFYFCQREEDPPWARMYGFRSSFSLVAQQWSGYALVTLIRKTSDHAPVTPRN